MNGGQNPACKFGDRSSRLKGPQKPACVRAYGLWGNNSLLDGDSLSQNDEENDAAQCLITGGHQYLILGPTRRPWVRGMC